jgi:hypothetical protein
MGGSPTKDSIVRRCHRWSDFTDAVEPLSAKEKGDAIERLVQLYLTLEPEYRTTLKKVWLLDEVPQKVRRRSPIPGPPSQVTATSTW